MTEKYATCPVCYGSGENSSELEQTRGLHLQDMPQEAFSDDFGKCAYCMGSGKILKEDVRRYYKMKAKEAKREKLGLIIGAFLGLIIGVLIGSFSERNSVPIYLGILGLVIGGALGVMVGVLTCPLEMDEFK